jgi:hypothetical protein
MVENTWFRSLLSFGSDTALKHLPRSHNTFKELILFDFAKRKQEIRKRLAASKSDIYLFFDLWSSPNGLALNGIAAYFLGDDYKLKTILLSLREVIGEHSGENIGQTVVDTIRDYGVEQRLGVFVLDNIGSNDTAVRYVIDELQLHLTHEKEHVRLRCLGHIINLAATEFLFGKNSDEFLQSVAVLEAVDAREQLQGIWVSKGPIGKLQNIISLIRASPQRRQAFAAIAGSDPDLRKSLMVIRNNSTRWNSTYLMLVRVLKLQSSLKVYVADCLAKKGDKTDASMKKLQQLTEEDWIHLQLVHDVLEPFHTATLRLQTIAQNGYGSLWQCLPVLEYLLQEMEKRIPKEGVENPLQMAANNAWNKLTFYYKLTDASPYYVASIVLNPNYKWQYCDIYWREKQMWIAEAKSKISKLWIKHSTDLQQVNKNILPPPPSYSPLSESSLQFEPIGDFLALARLQGEAVEKEKDEYKAYCSLPAPTAEIRELFAYWQTQEQAFPKLSNLAFNTLAIPAMSAECERVFSSCKLLITPTRNRLGVEAIEASECLRYWYRNNLVG